MHYFIEVRNIKKASIAWQGSAGYTQQGNSQNGPADREQFPGTESLQ